ncbi:MAG: EAL domain-containing protein [Selenomonadaceae bacterium]|nr:EAL domain-containing protein [Selenomonadaceae bacterium]
MIYNLKSIGSFVGALMIILNVSLIEAAPTPSDNHLKVGYVKDTGFVEENWAGHYTGYGYEYMEFLSNYGQWTFEYIPADTWVELGEMLNAGEVDIIPAMPGDYHLIPNVAWTDHVVGRFSMGLVIKDIELKPSMKLGIMNASYPTPSLPEIAKSQGFTYEFTTYETRRELFSAFKDGLVDGYVDAMLDSKIKYNVLALFDRQSYRLLVRSNNKELLDQLNSAMDEMLTYQPDIRDRLSRKYIRYAGAPLVLNESEREYLREKKKLTAVFVVNRKPYGYFEDGEAKGVIPEILKRFSKDLGIEFEFVKANSATEARQMIHDGKVDIMADSVCDYSQANLSNMKPTQPYLTMAYVPVKRQEHVGTIKTVAAVKDILYTKAYIEQMYYKENIIYYPTLEDCFRAVSDGSADVVFVPASEAPYYISDTETYNLKIMSESYFADEICLGVYKYSDPKLWHILTREINHLDSSYVRTVVNQTMEQEFHFTPKWFIYNHPGKIINLVILISWIVGGIILYKNQLKRKHIEVIQHMAYTDARYDLPNLAWLESQLPLYLYNSKGVELSNDKIYVVVLAMESKAAIVAQYGEELLIKHLQKTSKQLNQKSWVIMSAAGINANSLICICQAEGDTEIADYVTEALATYSYIETKDSRIWLHIKSGICEYKKTDLSVRQVVERANAACAESSINDVHIFDDKLQKELTLQHQIESHMEKALADGEFKAWYQPKYDIKTRRIVGAEALVRWQSSELGFMPPGKFIPLFEKNGFVIPVDYTILEQTFQLQKQRLAEGKEVVPISVNQSRLHMTEEGYLDKIKAIIDKYNLPPTGLVELEITETVFGDLDHNKDNDRAIEIISKLHEMGFILSVDDFGSGYSSFMMLNQLPMDVMKIDRSLLDASGDSNRMRSILANVIKLGKALNMQVICEGIETKEQEELLLELGCHYGQGYLNAKPMSLKDFVAFFEKRNSEVA